MKSNKKKTNKDRDKGIVWCMAEIYARKIEIESLKDELKPMKLAIKALQSQINDLSNPHKEKTT